MSSVPTPSDPPLELPSRYSLRALQESDLQELHALIERNRDELARWLSWAQQPNVESTRAHLARALAREADGRGLGRAVVIDGPIAGDIGLYADRDNASGAIGYWLDVEHRRRGVMTAAVRELTRHGFEQLGLHRIEIRTDVLNRSSRAVAERLGFQFEGILRESYRVSEEHYSDDAVYAMLASDPARRALAGCASVT